MIIVHSFNINIVIVHLFINYNFVTCYKFVQIDRAYAAHCIARYQNSYAPLNSLSDTDTGFSSWKPLKELLEIFEQFYVDKQTKCPNPVNLDDVQGIYLRCAMILALSSIRAKSGITPGEVVEAILNHAEHCSFLTSSAKPASDGVSSVRQDIDIIDESHFSSIMMVAVRLVLISHIYKYIYIYINQSFC